jgi:SOS response regulatory protein OraA/RecX
MKLERNGVAPLVIGEAAETFRRLGALDDERFARNRARALSERGWGDLAILAKLEAEGAPDAQAREAIAELTIESERAPRLVQGLAPLKAARLLTRRGFATETVEAVVPALDADTGAGLR